MYFLHLCYSFYDKFHYIRNTSSLVLQLPSILILSNHFPIFISQASYIFLSTTPCSSGVSEQYFLWRLVIVHSGNMSCPSQPRNLYKLCNCQITKKSLIVPYQNTSSNGHFHRLDPVFFVVSFFQKASNKFSSFLLRSMFRSTEV